MKQNLKMWGLLPLLLAGATASQLSAAEFTARIVDGLHRPLRDVAVELYWIKTESQAKAHKIDVLKLRSDRNGVVQGQYDEASIPPGESLSVQLSKKGYQSYSTGPSSEYVLKQEFRAKDVRRIAKLTDDSQQNELREVLAGDFEDREPSLEDLMFSDERRFRPALRSLVQDTEVGRRACQLLAYIGVPEDVRHVIQHAPPPKRELFEDRWAYGVVSALLDPTSEAEWAFLRRCALDEYEDAWVDAGAIKALRLVALPRSLEILQEVRKKNTDREELIDAAVDYIKANPPVLADRNLIEAGKKVALAIKVGDWKGNKKPRFNKEGDMALVDCEFTAWRDRLIHTATFHKVGDVWKLRGVRETMQALMPAEPEASKGEQPK